MSFIHDDITWCGNSECPIVNCMRNTKNMKDHSGLHSYAAFWQTEECPIYRMEKQAADERGEQT